jgi:hypothetical protein
LTRFDNFGIETRPFALINFHDKTTVSEAYLIRSQTNGIFGLHQSMQSFCQIFIVPAIAEIHELELEHECSAS